MLVDHVVWVNDVPARFRHFLVVFPEDNSLVHEALEWLRLRDIAKIEQRFVPETCIEQVQHRVLSATDVQIHATRFVAAHPVALRFLTDKPLIVARIAKSQVIPARACPLRHRVCLTKCVDGVTNPLFCFCERRFSSAGRLVIVERRRHDGQFFFIQRAMLSILPDDRERLAPISLTRE